STEPPERCFTPAAQILNTWPQGLASGARVPILITSAALARRPRPRPALSVAAPRTCIAALRFIIELPPSGRPTRAQLCSYTEVNRPGPAPGTTPTRENDGVMMG